MNDEMALAAERASLDQKWAFMMTGSRYPDILSAAKRWNSFQPKSPTNLGRLAKLMDALLPIGFQPEHISIIGMALNLMASELTVRLKDKALAEADIEEAATKSNIPPIAEIAQRITEESLGGEWKEGWKQGDDVLLMEDSSSQALPIRWTSIACSKCGEQVYFDKLMFRHRCSKCGYGF